MGGVTGGEGVAAWVACRFPATFGPVERVPECHGRGVPGPSPRSRCGDGHHECAVGQVLRPQAELAYNLLQGVVQGDRGVDLVLVDRHALDVEAEWQRAGVVLAEDGAQAVAADRDRAVEGGGVGEERGGGRRRW